MSGKRTGRPTGAPKPDREERVVVPKVSPIHGLAVQDVLEEALRIIPRVIPTGGGEALLANPGASGELLAIPREHKGNRDAVDEVVFAHRQLLPMDVIMANALATAGLTPSMVAEGLKAMLRAHKLSIKGERIPDWTARRYAIELWSRFTGVWEAAKARQVGQVAGGNAKAVDDALAAIDLEALVVERRGSG